MSDFYRCNLPHRLNELLNLADIHVLPQSAGAADLVMPSKLTGMLASGRPVIVTAHPGTELADVIDRVWVGSFRLECRSCLAEAISSPDRVSRTCAANWAGAVGPLSNRPGPKKSFWKIPGRITGLMTQIKEMPKDLFSGRQILVVFLLLIVDVISLGLGFRTGGRNPPFDDPLDRGKHSAR